jgi:hypothetical protein
MLNSLQVRREVASVMMCLPFGRFAEQLFWTLSLMPQLLEHGRQSPSVQPSDVTSVRSPDDDTIQDLQSRLGELKRDHEFLKQHHKRELAAVKKESADFRAKMDLEFVNMAREHLREEGALRERVRVLEGERNYAQLQVSQLETRNRGGSFDAQALMAFLNSGDNETRGN